MVADGLRYQGYYAVPCDFSETVSFGFGGEAFDIEPKDFLELGQVPTNPFYCIGGILGNDDMPSPWLMYVHSSSRLEYVLISHYAQRRNVLAERIQHLRYHQCQSRICQIGIRVHRARMGRVKAVWLIQKADLQSYYSPSNLTDNSLLVT